MGSESFCLDKRDSDTLRTGTRHDIRFGDGIGGEQFVLAETSSPCVATSFVDYSSLEVRVLMLIDADFDAG